MSEQDHDEPLPESGLERALRAGFAGEAAGDDAPSVLRRLGISGGADARVALPPAGEQRETPPVIGRDGGAPPSPERGNFRVYGELARGGMGAILRAHDADLGRDVALKVLHDGHAHQEAIVRRFVEEAQIGGQLQHPGIVPVHELGLLADRRPYFAMQLVQGRTLSTLLKERGSPAQDLPRFAGIFERVCQTVAYAHARGVVHRDLKPANVMIGDFGEVQVVDWGLAKVLRRGGSADDEPLRPRVATLRSGARRAGSASLSGAVMGTPRYMPPEQARGAVDELDERADVFSLGAILCEILTGRPPYDGDEDALERAAAGRLEPCVARLRAAAVDPELVALAEAALSAERDARPRDAGVLADGARAYLESLDERRRSAELGAAEARGRAEHERRARRLTVALAASVLALAALTAGVYAWRQRELGRRRAETVAAIQVALAEAEELERRAARTNELDAWVEARAAVDRAGAAADAGLTPPEFRRLVERRSADLRALEASSRAARRLAQREDALLSAIESLRVPDHIRARRGRERFYPTDWGWVAAAWDAAFLAADLPLRSMPGKEAARAILEFPSAPRIASALDEWALALRNAGDEEGAARLDAAARRADPDPTRTRVRDAIAAQDLEALFELAEPRQLAGLFPETLHLLGNTLGCLERVDEALAVLELGHARYPGDFPITISLARWATHERDDAEVLAYYAAALALRPENVEVYHELGNLEYRRNEFDRAIAVYRRGLRFAEHDGHLWTHLGNTLIHVQRFEQAVEAMGRAAELAPDEFMPHDNLGYALEALGRHAEALAPLDRAIELRPDVPNPYATRAGCYQALGRLAEAAEDLRTVSELLPEEVYYPYQLGFVLRELGEYSEARDVWTRMRAMDPTVQDVATMLGELWMHAERYDEAVPHLRDAVALAPEDALSHALLGGALTRTGEHAEALEHLGRARALGLADPALADEVEGWSAEATAALAEGD